MFCASVLDRPLHPREGFVGLTAGALERPFFLARELAQTVSGLARGVVDRATRAFGGTLFAAPGAREQEHSGERGGALHSTHVVPPHPRLDYLPRKLPARRSRRPHQGQKRK
jgi:hypothetical protein